MSLENYTLTAREHGKPVWAHKTKPVWVAEYVRRSTVDLYYQAYVAIAPIPAGAKPWDVPSRRLGDAVHGFPTLGAALKAGDEA